MTCGSPSRMIKMNPAPVSIIAMKRFVESVVTPMFAYTLSFLFEITNMDSGLVSRRTKIYGRRRKPVPFWLVSKNWESGCFGRKGLGRRSIFFGIDLKCLTNPSTSVWNR